MNPNIRAVFVAWQSPQTRLIHPVARLTVRDGVPMRYELVYVQGVRAALKEGFVPFARMRQLEQRLESDTLFPLFESRVMPRSRPDYEEHVRRLGLSGEPEPILLLARSEGNKATDNLELFAPPEFDSRGAGTWIYHAFARGVRYTTEAEARIARLQPGDELFIERQLENEADPNAMLILCVERTAIGWVPYTLVEDLCRVLQLEGSLAAQVVRVNVAPAPLHQRLLVRIEAQHRPGFAPLSTERYQPIAPDAAPLRFEPTADAR